MMMHDAGSTFAVPRNHARGLHHLTVWQKIPGERGLVLPVLYATNGGHGATLSPAVALLDYAKAHRGNSSTWLLQSNKAAGALIDYMIQLRPHYEKLAALKPSTNIHRKLFADFTRHLLDGTVRWSESGLDDPTGLFWLPRSIDEAERRLAALRDLARWLDTQGYGDGLAKTVLPIVAPADPGEVINFLYTAQIRRRVDMLSHLGPYLARSSRSERRTQKKSWARRDTNPVSFPSRYLVPLLERGFIPLGGTGITTSASEASNARLLTMLKLFGGIRDSEAFHLWVTDVQFTDGRPVVFLHNPSEAKVYGADGVETTRRKHLLLQYGLEPRNGIHRGRWQAGWKGVKGDMNAAQISWLPVAGVEEAVASALKHYLKHDRPAIMRIRRNMGLPDHPYLFVGTGQVIAESSGQPGDPYTMSAYKAAWGRALGRLRREFKDPTLVVKKIFGTTPYGCRHFYAGFLSGLGLDGKYIQECLHHLSPYSHLAYTAPSVEDTNRALLAAAERGVDPDWGLSAARSTSDALRALNDTTWESLQ